MCVCVCLCVCLCMRVSVSVCLCVRVSVSVSGLLWLSMQTCMASREFGVVTTCRKTVSSTRN